MSASVLIIGIDWQYTDKVARAVATKKDKMFLSVHDLIIYEMQGLIGDVNNYDKDYVNGEIKKRIIETLQYEDSIMSLDISNLNDEEIDLVIQKMPKIYVQKNNNDEVFNIVYEDRDKLLKECANFVVSEKDFEAQVEEVLEIVKNL